MKIVPENCNIPSVCVRPSSLGNKFKKIGYGSEGIVYRYNDSTAIKMFDANMLPHKLDKVLELYNLRDKNFCFPKGIVYTRNNKLVGIEMNLIKKSSEYKSFLNLFLEYIPYGKIPLSDLITILFKIDGAIQRVHSYGYTIGDLRPANILLNESNEPIFVDTDSGSYKNYDYDMKYPRIFWLRNVYKKDFSKIDNDIYVWAIMFLESLLTYNSLNKKFDDYMSIELYQSEKMFKELINRLNLEKDRKEGLRMIFSDKDNKPYIGDILSDCPLNKPLLSMPSSKILSLKYMMK